MENKKLVSLSSLFFMKNGVASTGIERLPFKKNENWIPYIRPSYRQDSCIDAYVNRNMFLESDVFSKETLYVSTNGQGSHTYSYVSTCDFVPNSDVTVLIPKRAMSLEEKLFYAMCITSNRFKFSYGRKPKGQRLADLKLPCKINADFATIDFLQVRSNMLQKLDMETLRIKTKRNGYKKIELVPLSSLFKMKNGTASSEVKRISYKKNENWIPYIRPSYRQSTSIDAYVNRNMFGRDEIYPKNTLYVSTDGQGSHTFSYVSVCDFVPNSNVTVLLPKREMTLKEKLFYAMCITHNRFKFSYGRKPKGQKLAEILLPSTITEEFDSINIDNII